MIASELAHAASHVVDAPKPERGEHERGRPPSGPSAKQLDLVGLKRHPYQLDNELVCLAGDTARRAAGQRYFRTVRPA